jgi:hypothetical protein
MGYEQRVFRGGFGDHGFAAGPNSRLWTAACHLLFALLVVANSVRMLRHAMWGDELQAFMIALASRGPLELFHNLRYDGHPGLWHALLWLVTRFTADPLAMKILHLAIALAVWLLIYRWSPFTAAEKFLLLLSYFLFWEYFVLSRGYALMTLLGLGFVALRAWRPRRLVLAWVLLGLLANTAVYGAIWSIAFAVFLVVQHRAQPRQLILGGAVYAILVALAIATMAPAPGTVGAPGMVVHASYGLSLDRFLAVAGLPIDALFPIDTGWIADFLRSRSVDWPPFWNPRPLAVLALYPSLAKPRLVVPLALAALIGGAWLFARHRRTLASLPVAELAIGWFGVFAFAYLWWQPFNSRYAGILFVMLVGAMWSLRCRAPLRAPRWWIALLIPNAIAGIYTLQSELRPFTEARDTALWLKRNGLAQNFLVGAPDLAASSVAAYLGRPIYYLECQCDGTFIEWNVPRAHFFDGTETVPRVRRAMAIAGAREAVLLRNQETPAESEAYATAPDLSFTLLRSFTGGVLSYQDYLIYRVEARPTPLRP